VNEKHNKKWIMILVIITTHLVQPYRRPNHTIHPICKKPLIVNFYMIRIGLFTLFI